MEAENTAISHENTVTNPTSADFSSLGTPSAQRLLLDLSALLVDALDYRATLTTIAELIVAALADVCLIDVLSDQGQVQQLACAHRDATQLPVLVSFAAQYAPANDPANPMMQVLASGQSIWGDLPGYPSAQRYLGRLGRMECHAFVIVALRARRRIIGTLSFGRLATAPLYTRSEVTLAEEIASRVASMVELAQLYEAEQRQRQAAEQSARRISLLQAVTAAFSKALTPAQVAEAAVTHGFKAIGATSGSLLLLAADGAQLELVRALGYPSGIVDPFTIIPLTLDVPVTASVNAGTSLFIRQYDQYPEYADLLSKGQQATGSHSWAVLLLKAETPPLGVLALSFREPQQFTPADQDFMLSLAQQCAQALERAQLFVAEQQALAAAQRAQQRLAFLADGSIVLTNSLDYQTTLVSLAELTVNVLADWCIVHICEDSGDWQRHIAASNAEHQLFDVWEPLRPGWQQRAGATGVAAVLETAEPLLLAALSSATLQPYAAEQAAIDRLLDRGLASLIVVPLTVRGQVIGTISLGRATNRPVYTLEDLDLAQELARRVTIAVDNSRLYWHARRSEQAHSESLALLDTVFNNAPVGFAFWNRSLRYVRINQTLAAMNRLPIEAHIGRTIAEILPDAPPEMSLSLQCVLDTGAPIIDHSSTTMSHLPISQQQHWLTSYYPVPGADGQIIGVGCVVADISASKRVEEQLRFLAEVSTVLASSLEYQTTLDNVVQLAIPQLADWCSVDIVDDAGLLLQYACASSAEFAWSSALALEAPTNSAHDLMYHVLQHRTVLHLDGDCNDALPFGDGSTPVSLWLQQQTCHSMVAAPLIVREQALGVMLFVRLKEDRIYTPADIALASELARCAAVAIDNAQLYAEAQRALHVRDQFLSVAAHELKTPITTLMGYSQLLQRRARREGNVAERDLRAIQSLSEQARRLHHLVLTLLDLSRLQVGQLSVDQVSLDLAALVQRIVVELEPTLERHTIMLELPPAPVLIAGDDLRLEQVIINLVQNAIKYSPDGGSIKVAVATAGHHARLIVTDKGIGIPDEAIPQLFGRFYRAINATTPRISGLGLGLYIVREIVTLHGGTVSVQSIENQGSTFTVELPLLG